MTPHFLWCTERHGIKTAGRGCQYNGYSSDHPLCVCVGGGGGGGRLQYCVCVAQELIIAETYNYMGKFARKVLHLWLCVHVNYLSPLPIMLFSGGHCD